MVRFPAPRDRLVDDFQRVALARPHSRGAQQCAQRTDIAPLPPDDFAYVTLGDLQFDHVVIEMIHENLIGSIDDPLRNLLDESAHVSSGFSHLASVMVIWWNSGCRIVLQPCRYAAGTAGATGGLE
jgi:hypothetical protein